MSASCNLFIRGLADSVTDEDFHNLFKEFGEIRRCVVVKNPDGTNKGIGFCDFASNESAVAAVQKLRNSVFHGNRLFIAFTHNKPAKAPGTTTAVSASRKPSKRDAERNKTNCSKFISLVLRHQPEAAGITVDEHGWAVVDELIAGVNKNSDYNLTREMLDDIVETDGKKRYSYSDDGTRIRANQGHSICVDVELKEEVPPEYLWHGTAERFADSIFAEGLKPMSRLYVHLSPDEETARKVGIRHGKLMLLRVHTGEMNRKGCCFFRSVNGVWLTNAVPPEYLERVL